MESLGDAGDIAGKYPRLPQEVSMIVGAVGAVSAVLLAPLAVLLSVEFPMRRSLRIRTMFEPTRLSSEYLRSAYEMTVPIARRVVNVASTDDERDVADGADRVEVTTVRSSGHPGRTR